MNGIRFCPPPMTKRLLFPVVNGIVIVMLFALVGYYVFDILRWALIGLASGLGIGLLVEFGLGLFGGWDYRRRALFLAGAPRARAFFELPWMG